MVEAVVQGDASLQELLDAWLTATVYCSRPQRPGVLVAEVDGGQVVGVCTSLEALARFAGEGDWFSTTGADLLSQLPAEVDIVLDPAGPHPLRLRPSALRARPRLRLDNLSENGDS